MIELSFIIARNSVKSNMLADMQPFTLTFNHRVAEKQLVVDSRLKIDNELVQ